MATEGHRLQSQHPLHPSLSCERGKRSGWNPLNCRALPGKTNLNHEKSGIIWNHMTPTGANQIRSNKPKAKYIQRSELIETDLIPICNNLHSYLLIMSSDNYAWVSFGLLPLQIAAHQQHSSRSRSTPKDAASTANHLSAKSQKLPG